MKTERAILSLRGQIASIRRGAKNLLSLLLILVVTLATTGVNVFAQSDGTYVVTNKTSYTNPDTGRTEDGGTNLDIGEAMARSLTQQMTLHEVKDGKHYLTLRLGLSSYTNNMRISLQSEKGNGQNYNEASFNVVKENTETDTKEYKFEVASLDLRIKLSFFVKPMNRDIIFFVTLDPASLKDDNGSFAASDKATSGYGSGFASGLTDGDAEEGKMPTIVEELTGVSEVKPAQKPTEEKNPAKPVATNSNPTSSQGSANAAGGNSTNTTTQSITTEKPTVETSEEEITEEEFTEADSPEIAEEVELESEIEGLEEKIITGNIADLADQGLTQFDSAGNLIEETTDEQTNGPIIAIAVGLLLFCVALGYYFYTKKRKKALA